MIKKTVEDVAIGTGAITTPIWLEPASLWVQFFVMVGGLVLVLIRIRNALAERKNGTD